MSRSDRKNQTAQVLVGLKSKTELNYLLDRVLKKALNELERLKIKLASILDRVNSKLSKIKRLKLVVTVCKIDKKLGLEVPIESIFQDDRGILSLHSNDARLGKRNFVTLNLSIPNSVLLSRSRILVNLMLSLGTNSDPRFSGRILSIPFRTEDVLNSISIKDRFGVLVCTYLVGDRNMCTNNISDESMQELLQKSDLRLGISQELCQAYEAKYNFKFWYFPPVVAENLINKKVVKKFSNIDKKKGILVDNISSRECFDRLRNILSASGIELNWYVNKKIEQLSDLEKEELAKDGILFRGDRLAIDIKENLEKAAYVVILTEAKEKLARLNLPSEITYITAAAKIPIIVMGSKNNAAAKFVERHKIGVVCDYDRSSFQEAVNYVNQPKVRKEMRYFAAKLGEKLSAKGIKKWVWESLKWGRAADLRYENLDKTVTAADVIITLNEVDGRDSKGALIKRIFAKNNNIISIRSQNQERSPEDFGNISIWLENAGMSRQEIFEEVLRFLGNSEIKRVFCIPDSQEELIWAIAIKELFGVPIVTYIIDDRNYYINNIPDDLMGEFLNKCSLRLVTNPELRDAYEGKYGLKFWLLPPIVQERSIRSNLSLPARELLTSQTGATIENIASSQQFEMLSNTIKTAGAKIDWYSNKDEGKIDLSREELAAKGLKYCGLLTETELAQKILKYPYVIVTVGTLDEKDDRPELRLSLSAKIISILASTNTPIIVMGSKETSAAQFVDRFGIGVTCDYDGASLAKAIEYVTKPKIQESMRQKAANIAGFFTDKGIEEWIWQSLTNEEPIDKKFERLMPRSESDLVVFVEPPTPKTVSKDFIKLYQVMRRLVNRGFNPDFIIDVGCSYGIWSSSIGQLFPNARFIAIDPLVYQYQYSIRNHHLSLIPNLEVLPIAVSDRVGNTSFQVSSDLYGSSLLHPADFRSYQTVEVEVNTLDNLSIEKNITGRGILKLDVQCGEHLVLEGAKNFLRQVDILVAELSLLRYAPQALTWTETIALIEGLGFRYYDETDEWRSPVDGTLLQKEAVFIRKDLFVPEISKGVDRNVN